MVVNPKGGNNHAIAVTTRSGRGGDVNASKQKQILSDKVELQEDEIPLVVENVIDENSLSINVHLVEALEQMPGYAKFMKDLVTKKRSMDFVTIKITHQRLLGIIDDALVRVDKFILPDDFVILNCEVDYEVPIILGKPFVATGKTLVDVEAGELIFRVGDEKVVFYACKSMKQPNSSEVCSFVDLVTTMIVDDTSAMINVDNPIEVVLLNLDVNEDEG
ncbi:uncharacterized protein [Nicotiana sylvestris]|uniref:uncharacterized protein n=1 Tax=Nicotiana sylvestris TaxID=4096 RepID=UPI00388CA223